MHPRPILRDGGAFCHLHGPRPAHDMREVNLTIRFSSLQPPTVCRSQYLTGHTAPLNHPVYNLSPRARLIW
jgi:hypothetical protein